MAKVYLAPEKTYDTGRFSLFLAGSIDMGKAGRWQDRVCEELNDFDIDIFNPRRDDWDSTWKQEITNDKFREQVEWELEHQEKANFICFYFDPTGQAPITLLELGLFHSINTVVCCPSGYFRKGNVDIVCNRYAVPMVETLDDMISYLRARIKCDQYF